MRIETSGKYAWLTDLDDNVGDLLDENTRSGAVDGACEFTRGCCWHWSTLSNIRT